MSLPIIVAQDIGFSYSQNKLFNNLSFSINEGDYIGIIGPNGCGKSTLLKLLLGILKPSFGKITIENQLVGSYQNWQKVGFVPQISEFDKQNFPASVWEIVSSNFQGQKAHKKQVVEDSLKKFQLFDIKDQILANLSGGQKQRTFLARSLVNKPKILFLDEPTLGVDSASQSNFYNYLEELNKNEKLTIVFISHDLEMVAKSCNRILCISKNGIGEVDTGSENQEIIIQNLKRKIEHIHEH